MWRKIIEKFGSVNKLMKISIEYKKCREKEHSKNGLIKEH